MQVRQVASSIRLIANWRKVEWLLNYVRNANKLIPVAPAITTKKLNAPRRLTPMRLLNPVTHRQKTKSAHIPEINPEAGSSPTFQDLQLCRVNE
jgi:hypothetical protein